MIETALGPLLSRWDALDDVARRQATLVLLAGVLFLVHYGWYSHWFIEDAAISFAYARYLASGEGLVPYAGGELVEGFSNPTWTLLLALQDALGLNPWVASKLTGALFGVVGLIFAWRWARRLMPERPDLGPAWVAVLLALSPQYVTWAASGLENSAVTVLMAIGGWGILRESEARRRIPWSGLAWGLLAISRPEAPAYAAIAGLVGFGAVSWRQGAVRGLDWAWRWGLLAALPFFAWHLYAFAAFAWEAPNTYYAKLHDGGRFQPWEWAGKKARSWGYLRRYALWYGHGFVLWLYLLGQSGFKKWRSLTAIAISVALYIVLVPGTVWLWSVWGEAPLEGAIGGLSEDGILPIWPFAKDPSWLSLTRILGIGVIAFAAPFLGIGRKGFFGRSLAWWLTCFICFFALYAGGDWMDGVRWMNLCSVPLTILLVDGVMHAIANMEEREALGPVLARVIGAVPLVAVGVLMVVHTVQLIRRPDTSPYDVQRRVRYGQLLMDRLDVRRPIFMDVDMGAHQWFAGPTSPIVDVAGLIDIPMGHHKWDKKFVLEYVFEERRPHLAHIHGGWASKSGLKRQVRFRREYLAVTNFPVSVYKTHVGNHVRRDLVFPPDKKPNPERAVTFQGGFALADWAVPAEVVAPGNTVTVQVWWERQRGIPRGERPLVFLTDDDGKVAWSKELPPAYDWLSIPRWKRGQIARGVHRLELPADLELGTYDLGFVILGKRGISRAMTQPDGTVRGLPVYARGEVRWPDVLTVVDDAELRARGDAEADRIMNGAESCEDRETRWERLRHSRAPDHPWRRAVEPAIDAALARCWAAKLQAADADPSTSDAERIRLGERARWWDHRPWEVQSVTRRVAVDLRARSRELQDAGDLDAAYVLSRGSLLLDPLQGWERRRAERLRDRRLGIKHTPSLSDRVFERLGWEW